MRFLKFFCLIILTFSLSAEEDKETLKSIDEERRETLLYGIDSEILEVLTTITKDKSEGFEKELLSIIKESLDPDVKEAAVKYFMTMEDDSAVKAVIPLLEDVEYEEEYDLDYVKTVMNYLGDMKSEEAIPYAMIFLENDNNAVVISSLKLLGKNKHAKAGEKLLTMLEEDDLSADVYVAVIDTLGEVGNKKAVDKLIELAGDEDEETTVRNHASASLGKIGDEKALAVLKSNMTDKSSALIRMSAMEALSQFDVEETDQILMNALKDSYWRIRLMACKSLAERKTEEAFPALRYKAEKDPENRIREAAVKAIGDIDSKECRNYLMESFKNEKSSSTLRYWSMKKLIELNIDLILPEIEKMYEEKSEDEKYKFLEVVLKEVSAAEHSGLNDLYEKMLKHENYIFRLYAVKGIRKNRFTRFKETLKIMSEEDENRNVKKFALSALEDL